MSANIMNLDSIFNSAEAQCGEYKIVVTPFHKYVKFVHESGFIIGAKHLDIEYDCYRSSLNVREQSGAYLFYANIVYEGDAYAELTIPCETQYDIGKDNKVTEEGGAPLKDIYDTRHEDFKFSVSPDYPEVRLYHKGVLVAEMLKSGIRVHIDGNIICIESKKAQKIVGGRL